MLVPAIFALVIPDMLERSAVPGSFPRRVGVTLASAIVTTAIWLGPAIVALVLGSLADGAGMAESGRSDVVAARPSLAVACVLGGIAALAFALLMTK